MGKNTARSVGVADPPVDAGPRTLQKICLRLSRPPEVTCFGGACDTLDDGSGGQPGRGRPAHLPPPWHQAGGGRGGGRSPVPRPQSESTGETETFDVPCKLKIDRAYNNVILDIKSNAFPIVIIET